MSRKPLLFVFNEHHEAFLSWQVAKSRGFIPQPVDLFHIDAHDDMDRPRLFEKSLYLPGNPDERSVQDYYTPFVRDELFISNFIVPAVLCGIVKNVHSIHPAWKKPARSRKRMNVASIFGEGKHLKYDIRLKSGDADGISKAFPDLKTFTFSKGDASIIPVNRKVLLDIDLDYFACRDSIMNHMSYELEISRDQFEHPDSIRNDPTLPYSRLLFDFSERAGRFFVRISFRKNPEVAHLPSNEKILEEIRALVDTLVAKKTRPAVITVSRSCHSGYCPPEYGTFIEENLVPALRAAF